MHSKGSHKQKEKTFHRIGENICKWSYWKGICLQNIQAAHVAQYQKTKQPNQKMGRRNWYRRSYLQSRNRDTDRENKYMDTKGERGEWDELGHWDWHIYTIDTMYKIDNKWEPTV